MARTNNSAVFWLCAIVVCLALVSPACAFGAGNIASISKIEGANWRHGDIEDTLLGLFITRIGSGRKFSKTDVKRVYFGNWLRDYSQAVDVGTVKSVSAEAIRLLLWVLGFMSFGYGTREFEVTSERLGCYRPEEHIDNPKDYADNVDARQYDRRLRGPVDERRELAVDERNGLKNYIASEDLGITTSTGMVRDLLRRCIDLARRSKQSDNKLDFYEALRLLGTATHCMEDLAAHSNYVELSLIELGERDVFPHVGRRTQIQVRGARDRVFPLITGTFGGVDFLHSVCGEISDKATQSEIDELEGSINDSKRNQNISQIKKLLDQLPPGLFGGDDKKAKVDQVQANAASAQMQNMSISPKEPEEFTRQMQQITQQIYPVLEFHDELMRNITEVIEKVPILPDIIEQLQEQVSIFVFSAIAPFILPVIGQIKSELQTGSTEIIESSKNQQHIVFNDDNSTDPTHSMLSKDHFSNILNEVAGKTASQILKWAIPQIVECWDDPRADAERTINRIVNGVFHHPALRDQGDDGARDCRQQMFGVVENWWRQKDEREKNDFRQKLSREGVENGRNHKEGVHDKGHGCGKPLGFANVGAAGGRDNTIANALYGGLSQEVNQAVGGQMMPTLPQNENSQAGTKFGKAASEAVGGGVLGSVLGGIVGGVGGSILGGAFKDDKAETDSYQSSSYNPNTGSQTQSYIETGHHAGGQGRPEAYGQAEYKRTDYPSGGRREEYNRFEQTGSGGQSGGYQYSQTVETRRTEGGYQKTEESRYEQTPSSGRRRSGSRGRRGSDDEDDYAKKERKKREKEEKKRRKQEGGYGGRDDSDSDDDKKNKPSSGNYGRQEGGYGRQESSGYGRQESSGHGRQEGSGYGRQESTGYGGESGYSQQSSGYGQQSSGYGQQSSGYGQQSSGYGQQSSGYGQQSSGYGQESSGYGRQEGGRGGESGYGRESGYSQQQSSGYGDNSSYGRNEGGGYGRQEGGRHEGGHHGRRDDDDEYGGRRRDDDDDDDNRRRRNEGGYGSGGYGSGGYGGSGY